MAVTYQQVPITLDPHTPIPADALPSAGLDDADADLVVQLSADYTAETAITIDVSSAAPFVADVTLTAATPRMSRGGSTGTSATARWSWALMTQISTTPTPGRAPMRSRPW
jgi:hypothetical protein